MELTRLLSSFLVGWLLGINGSVSQVLTHNKLASPSTIGIDGFAVLVSLCFFFLTQILNDQTSSFAILVLVACFVVMLLTLLVSRKIKIIIHGQDQTQKLVLIGLSFNLLISGYFYLFYYLSMVANVRFPSDLFFGDFRSHSSFKVMTLFIITFLFVIVIFRFRRHWSSFSLGSDVYRNLWGRTPLFSWSLFFIVLSTICTTYFFGVFSLLGLLFPYFFRSVFKQANISQEVQWIGLFAGTVLCLTDLVCYLVPIYSSEIPAGLVIAIFGPFFLIFKILENRRNVHE